VATGSQVSTEVEKDRGRTGRLVPWYRQYQTHSDSDKIGGLTGKDPERNLRFRAKGREIAGRAREHTGMKI